MPSSRRRQGASRGPAALILAAGQGKRMRSSRAKLLHQVAGFSVVGRVVETARAAKCRRIVAVLGVQGDEVRAAIEAAGGWRKGPEVEFCRQKEQLGTAHAVLAAEKALGGDDGVLIILNGDVPLVRPSTLKSMVAFHRRKKAALTVVTARLEDPAGYGRILRGPAGDIVAIREQADIKGDRSLERIQEINSGLYCVDLPGLFKRLKATSRGNAQNEYYLPDLVGVLRREGARVEAMLHPDADEVLGINNRGDLSRAVRALHRRKAEELMAAGVTLIDPDSTYVDPQVKVGHDCVIYPMVHLEGRTRIGSGSIIRAGVRIADSVIGAGVEVLDHCLVVESAVGQGARIGPFAHLRPGTRLGKSTRIGNFVETKKARIGDNSKANHLTYLGDAEIGKNVNIGAGTITCNYDGWKKSRTVLKDGVFIGSDTQLVAPVSVGRGAFVGAGSTVTKDVPADSLALSRAKQQNFKGWASRRRAAAEKAKKKSGKG